MEQIFWRDLEDQQGQWAGLSIEVNRPRQGRPPLHLLSGNNCRLKLMLNDIPLLWATIATSYYGAWLVRNPQPVQLDLLPVAAISSADVEHHAHLPPEQRIKAWSRYFITQLLAHQADFLYPGHWVARPMLPTVARGNRGERLSGWYFSTQEEVSCHLPQWSARGAGILDNVQPSPAKWLDWDLGPVIGLHTVDLLAGRLKWWRKKAREGSLPPILLWYVGGMCSYVIIDGHYRLQAALAENVQPSFIVLSSTEASPTELSADAQQRVLRSLLLQSEKNPDFDTRTMNQVLINAFDDRPYHWPGTHAWAGIASDREWRDEVTRFLQDQGATDDLEDILGRCQRWEE